ncbi:MAG TPA: hypothetical protein PKU80_10610 [Candidatus Limiplasma sp.]|nr:hypothetical protein [Candidatus Limiplasma sp.]HRX07670.1 hypothetical protein [Candidatus Limiplasma sp.]
MDKTGITLDQLEQVDEPIAEHLRNFYSEKMVPRSDGSGFMQYYKCPCGKGHVVDEQTGEHDHITYFTCDECMVKYDIVK